MFIHAVWAAVVLKRKNEKAIQNFHKFSVLVWAIWLIPYFSPMFFNLAGEERDWRINECVKDCNYWVSHFRIRQCDGALLFPGFKIGEQHGCF